MSALPGRDALDGVDRGIGRRLLLWICGVALALIALVGVGATRADAATFTITPTTAPHGVQGLAGYSVTFHGPVCSSSLPCTWSIANTPGPGLSFVPSSSPHATATLSGTPPAAGSYGFDVTVTRSGGSGTRHYTLVVDPPLTITTTTLPGGVVGLPYAGATLAAIGGTHPLTWSAALPPGLTVDPSTGVIRGTPTTAATTLFLVTVRDAGPSPYPRQQVATTYLGIVVAPPVAITTSSLPDAVVGKAYTVSPAATGGSPPYTWSSTGSLPPGLMLSPGTGVISGTPTTPQSTTVTLTVADSTLPTRSSATRSFTIRIPPPLTISTSRLNVGRVGSAYSARLAATGGIAPDQWTFTGGSLPPGLILDRTGAITGTPTGAGTWTFTFSVRDSSSPSQTATGSLSLTIGAERRDDDSGSVAGTGPHADADGDRDER